MPSLLILIVVLWLIGCGCIVAGIILMAGLGWGLIACGILLAMTAVILRAGAAQNA